jgi:hypothetical protein
MIWDVDKVSEMASMSAMSTVEDEFFSGRQDLERAKLAVCDAMADLLVEHATSHGVEIERKDIRVEEQRIEAVLSLQLTAHWQPLTHNVELMGGPKDGNRFSLNSDVTSQKILLLPPEHRDVEAASPEEVDAYEFAGWNTELRCWVYSYRIL